ncbi:protein snakeskin-like [Anastrepha ludens]|uniref:protein snakeskin-like n=1 Tax=Anastrepha ludens TaxID=28586 RepID=UPI0023AF167C|nr:protein snakeskin-like [Anastrepha ludens]XP_053954452.1 protein snakeskin-like [Anastrepha ludens]XP_053954453.1 protein snakeskin-like [Anastrepha ludens]XP_053954454.1 protein snakeskin-like [Anastrepha ludens]
MDSRKMVSYEIMASICLKILKLLNNLGVLVLYRTGNGGDFLGIGGNWNLQEKHNPALEMLASGVFVGFIIYTAVVIIGYCFGGSKDKRDLTDILMNTVGTALWITVGVVAIHYWLGYMSDGSFSYASSERSVGLAMGALCIAQGALYLVDTILGCVLYYKGPMEYAVISHYTVE